MLVDRGFVRALSFTLKFEGGKSYDPRDPGGRTNQGITQRAYNTWRRKKGVADRDVYDMVPVERDEIYKIDYWDRVTGDSLPVGVDLAVFDYAVNSGPDRALRVYASVGHGKSPAEAIHAVCSNRLSFLHSLRTWAFFGRGWARRVAACEVAALKMAGASLDEAHGRVKNQSQNLGVLLSMLIGGASWFLSRVWQFPHWFWFVIGFGGTILLWYYLHTRIRAKIRMGTLEEAIAKEDVIRRNTLGEAMANMKAASDKMMHR